MTLQNIFTAPLQDDTSQWGSPAPGAFDDEETKRSPWQRYRDKRQNLRSIFWSPLSRHTRENMLGEAERKDYGQWFDNRVRSIKAVRNDPWPASYRTFAKEAFDKIPAGVLLDFARSDMEDDVMMTKVRAFVGFHIREEARKRYDALSDGQKARADHIARNPAGTDISMGKLAPGQDPLESELEAMGQTKSAREMLKLNRSALPEVETAQLASAFGFSSKSVQNAIADHQNWLSEKILDNAVMETVTKIAEAPARALDWLAQQASGEKDKTFGQVVFGGVEKASPEAFTVLSGTTDAVKVFYLDAFVMFGKGAKLAKAGQGLGRVDDYADAVKAVERGIGSAPVERWMRNFVKRPSEMRDPGTILREAEMFGWKLDAAKDGVAIDRLSKAKNVDELKTVLKEEALGLKDGVQRIEALPYLRPTHHVRRAWEGGKLGKVEINNPMLGPFRSTWGNKLDPHSPVFEKQLRRFGDYMWGTKTQTDDAARIVDGHVGRITRISDKATRTKAMGTMLEDGLSAFATRHGASAEEAAKALEQTRNSYPGFLGRTRKTAYGFDPAGEIIDTPFRQTQLATAIPVPSYSDLLAYKTELLDVMGRSTRAGARRASKKVGDNLAVLTRGVIRLWLAKPSTLVRAGIEEAFDLAGHPEFGKLYRRQKAHDLLDSASTLLHRGHPLRPGSLVDATGDMRRELAMSQGYRGHVGMASQSITGEIADELTKAADDLDLDLFHWKPVDAGDATYSYAWYHVVNHQILQDPLSAIIVSYGDDLEAARSMGRMWLDTPEGQKYLRQFPKAKTAAQVEPHMFKGSGIDEVDKMLGHGATPSLKELERYAVDDGIHLYHYTPRRNWDSLKTRGLRPGKVRPNEPTGVYFGASDADLVSLTPTRNASDAVLLRTRRESVAAEVTDMYGSSGIEGEFVVKGDVSPDVLEFLGADGKWHPLGARAATDTILDWHVNDIRRNIPDSLMASAQGALASGGKVSLDDLERAHASGVSPSRVVGPVPVSQLPAEEAKRLGYFQENTASKMLAKPYGWGATFGDYMSRRPGFKAAREYRKQGLERLKATRKRYGVTWGLSDETIEKLSTNYANREMWRMDNPLERARSDFWLRNVSPFQYNQNNFMKRWGRRLATNPGYVSRLRNMVGAMEDIGFIQKDETGNLTFQIPISAEFYSSLLKRRKQMPKHYARLAVSLGFGATPSGAGIFKSAPFDAFGQLALPPGMPFAASVEPGFGPAITIPVQAITANKPKLDWARGLFLGGYETWDPEAGFINNIAHSVGSSWARDIAVAVTGGKGDRAYVGTVRDMVAWAEFSDKADIYDPKKQKHYEALGRLFFAVRGLTKYVFPYAVSSPVLMEERDDLDKMIDKHGYEEGTALWLDKYDGKGTALLVSLTEPAATPENANRPPKVLLAPSEYAEQFYRENPDFFREFPNVAGLFTHRMPEDRFDPKAMRRQLQRGQRVGRNMPQFWLELNIEAGSREYFDTVIPALDKAREAGANDEQVGAAKRAAVAYLEQLFPGTRAFLDDWSERKGLKDQAVAELRKAVKDKRVADRSDVKPLVTWLSYYDRFEAEAKAKGYVSLGRQKGTRGYRAALKVAYDYLMEESSSGVLEKAYTYLFRADIEDEDEENGG